MADSILSVSQFQTLSTIKRNRQHGFLPSISEVDFLLDLLDQLLTPGHTCVDNSALRCLACEGITYDA